MQKMVGSLGDFPNVTSIGTGPFYMQQAGSGGYGANSVVYYRGIFDTSRVARTSVETRPLNVAYHPRIHA